jgi:hypothetical protein
MNRKEWTKTEEEYILNNFKNKSATEIANDLNRTMSAVRNKIKRLGLKKEKYHYNKSFFNFIDNEIKAYWLGFLSADGWISHSNVGNRASYEIGIQLQLNDIEHLRQFNKDLNGNIEVKVFTKKCGFKKDIHYNRKEEYNCCGIRIYNKEMYEALVALGFSNHKSFNIRIPKIDKKYMVDFIRGYYDGNGCLVQNKQRKALNFDFCTASIDMANDLRDVLYNDFGIGSYIYKEPSSYRVYIRGLHNSYKFGKLLYDNPKRFLKRKYQKFNQIVDEYNILERL